MKDVAGQPFIEAGNGKILLSGQSQYRLHPFWSYNVTGGSNTTVGGWVTSIWLSPATYYKYTVWNVGSQTFRARQCRGFNWTLCTTLVTAPFNRNYFSHTTVGGEGNCANDGENRCPVGYIAADKNKFLWTDNQWKDYCYTETHFDFNDDYSWSFSGCSNARWTLHYR